MLAQVDDSTRPWNHNIHYGRIVMGALPRQCRSALDLGCGEGWLTGALGRAVPVVVGLDRDEPSVVKARSNHPRACRCRERHPWPATSTLTAGLSTGSKTGTRRSPPWPGIGAADRVEVV